MSGLVTDKEKTTFRPLARYTQFVRSTKVLLAIVALLLLAVLLLYPFFRQQGVGVRIALSNTAEKPPQATSMTNARFHGLDKENQLYTVNARLVTEVDEEHINLDGPNGEILLKSGQKLSAKANSGVFNKKTRMLKLRGGISLQDQEGYTLTTETLTVDISNNSAATSTEVFGNGPLGKLKAYGGAMADVQNQQILFQGPVFVTLVMDKKSEGNKKGQP